MIDSDIAVGDVVEMLDIFYANTRRYIGRQGVVTSIEKSWSMVMVLPDQLAPGDEHFGEGPYPGIMVVRVRKIKRIRPLPMMEY